MRFSPQPEVVYRVPKPAFTQTQQWKHQTNVWNLFKVNNKDNNVNVVVLVSLLLTLAILQTFF